MKFKALIFTMVIVLSLGLFLSYSIFQRYKSSDVDIIYINEVTKTAEANMKGPGRVRYPEKKYDFEIIRISNGNYDEKLNTALKNGNTVVDLQLHDRIIGKECFILIIKPGTNN